MKKYLSLFLSILLITLIFSCKSSSKQYEKGNYESSVLLAIKKLRSKPSHQKSKVVLKNAYEAARKTAASNIQLQKSKTDILKWDRIINQYKRLNNLYDELLRCPSCLTVVEPSSYQIELNKALIEGAKAHFEIGLGLFQLNTKEGARQAYKEFQKALSYKNDYPQAGEYLQKSLELGHETIAIRPIPVAANAIEISASFFVRQLIQRLNQGGYLFASFYTVDEAQNNNLEVNQIIEMRFDDFRMGQSYTKEKVQTFVKDSVVVATVKDSLGAKKPIYGTVEADYHSFYKSIESSGLLDLKIINLPSEIIAHQDKFPGTAVWEIEWAYYQGDKRALTKKQLRLSKLKELPPPPPQELFIGFTEPIYIQVLSRLRDVYQYLR